VPDAGVDRPHGITAMQVINPELLKKALELNGPTTKFVMGENAIAFFPVTQEHRDMKPCGLSYEDDYRGNAVAGLVSRGRIEIRFHSAYSEFRIKAIWLRVCATPEFTGLTTGSLYYQGRELR